MALLQCSGWWEQTGFGRQPMHNLQLSFSNGVVGGTGVDMVGEFRFDGYLKGDVIYLRKRYLRQHEIEYHGTSIGEGAYTGRWHCFNYPGGRWLIGVKRLSRGSASLSDEVAIHTVTSIRPDDETDAL